ncbi:MAG: response regulator, partial [Rhodospirillaceae bacterium]
MVETKTILLIEDAVPLAGIYSEYMRDDSYRVIHVETGAAAFAALATIVPDAVVLDLELPDVDGLIILKHLREQTPDTSVVVITAHGSVNTAVEAMRQGAFDFIVKPFNAARLKVTLRNALERKKLNHIVEVYRKNLDRNRFYDFIGD